ncbi:MAG TPA: hypothetical protein VGJ86_17910 [Acidimicrobiales bacterium]|jgi:hypothetical protein
MYQITSAIVEERQNDLRAEAKRFHLSRLARRVIGTAKPRSW